MDTLMLIDHPFFTERLDLRRKVYLNSYVVREDGEVFSFIRYKTLKHILASRYTAVGMSIAKNTTRLRYIHRLVAECFIPNPHNLPQVNHKDYDKRNNHVSNLEWCTPKENQQHSLKHGWKPFDGVQRCRGEDHPRSILNTEDVLRIRKLRDAGIKNKDIHKLFPEIKDVSVISAIVCRKTWKHI